MQDVKIDDGKKAIFPIFRMTGQVAQELSDWVGDPTIVSDWLLAQQERVVLQQRRDVAFRGPHGKVRYSFSRSRQTCIYSGRPTLQAAEALYRAAGLSICFFSIRDFQFLWRKSERVAQRECKHEPAKNGNVHYLKKLYLAIARAHAIVVKNTNT